MLLFIFGVIIGLNLNSVLTDAAADSETDDYYPSLNFSDTFDWKLLRQFSSQPRNLIISPVSLKILLALLYQGSSGGTEREFQSVLQYMDKETVRNQYSQILQSLQPSKTNEFLLNIGTTIYLDSPYTIKPNYYELARDYFKTLVASTNFSNPDEASNNINSWISHLTNGKVAKLVNPNDLQKTIMLVANAIYFKGTWLHQFPKKNSYRSYFYLSPRGPEYSTRDLMMVLDVPYMTVTDQFFFKESPELDSKIIRLPYKGSSYAMFIILPNSIGGLSNSIKKMNLNKISQLLYSMDHTVVEVSIPKFKFASTASFTAPLKQFGLRQMFQNTASFPGILKGNTSILRQLEVSNIVQKSGIEVDEEGSVAFSATDVNIGNKFGEPKSTFNATHPFLFFIEGPNGNILFVGKVENPLEEESIALPSRVGTEEGFISSQNGIPGAGSNSVLNLDEMQVPIPPNREELTYRFNLFDLELLNAYADSSENVLVSPASLKSTLAMLLEGAIGHSASEISEALRIPDISQKGVRDILMELLSNINEPSGKSFLENHNAIFYSNKCSIWQNYTSIIEGYYRGAVRPVNFDNPKETALIINKWINESSHGIIPEGISPQSLRTDMSMIISNVLFFKGKWHTKFSSTKTTDKCFYTSAGCVQIPTMHTSGIFNNTDITNLRAQAIVLPYEGNYSMLVILPNEDSSIRSVVRDLGHFKLIDIIEQLKMSDIDLEFPKLSISYSSDMRTILQQLKIRDIFTPGKANLHGIVEGGDIWVDSIAHKTGIIVDEEGTVAAASTSAVIVPLMRSTLIAINRPFVLCIFHKETLNIMFEGIIQNPQQQVIPNWSVRSGTARSVPILQSRFKN